MCRQVTCTNCGKPTYAGCGLHVEQVLAHVPEAERCQCRRKAEGRRERPDERLAAGWLGRWFRGA